MKNNATNSPVLTLVYGAAIAAIYVVLTMVFLPISFGPIQFRISELLCVLPYFTPAAIPGLFIGCLLANFLGGSRCDLWKYCDPDRCGRFLPAPEKPLSGICSADPREHDHCSVGAPLRIRF